MKITIEYDDPRLNTLQRLHSAKPFREFDVITTDGKTYHVEKSYEFTFDEARVIVANEKKTGLYRLPISTVQSIREAVRADRS